MAKHCIEFLFDLYEFSSSLCVLLLWGKFATRFHPNGRDGIKITTYLVLDSGTFGKVISGATVISSYHYKLPHDGNYFFSLFFAKLLALWISILSTPFCSVSTKPLNGNKRCWFILKSLPAGMRCSNLKGILLMVVRSIKLPGEKTGEKTVLFKIHCLSCSLYYKCIDSLKLL